MGDTKDKNWQELGQQVADLQVKAFLRLICDIGEVLDRHRGYALPSKVANTRSQNN